MANTTHRRHAVAASHLSQGTQTLSKQPIHPEHSVLHFQSDAALLVLGNFEKSRSMKALPSKFTKTRRLGIVAGSLIAAGLITGFQPLPTTAQEMEAVREAVLPADPSVLAAIRQAPFSQVFSVNTPNAGKAVGIKDRDYKSGGKIGVFSLWFDAPSVDLLQVALLYCLPDQQFARTRAHLVAVELMDNGQTLAKIDQPAVSTNSISYEVEPAQYVASPFFIPGSFYGSFWNPYGYTTPYLSSTYLPGVECSLGGSRLDLKPVKSQLANLPNKTLKMRLLFNNGMTSDWRLGRKTVATLKQASSIKGQ